MKTIMNVTIGDRFKTGKHTTAKVIDFYEIRSVTTGMLIEPIGYQCIAQSEGLATNLFDTPFSIVVRNRI